MKTTISTTSEFFNGEVSNLKPVFCEAYGWHESDLKGLVYETTQFGKVFYLIPATNGMVLSYSEYNGRLICTDWCKPSQMRPEFQKVINN